MHTFRTLSNGVARGNVQLVLLTCRKAFRHQPILIKRVSLYPDDSDSIAKSPLNSPAKP